MKSNENQKFEEKTVSCDLFSDWLWLTLHSNSFDLLNSYYLKEYITTCS